MTGNRITLDQWRSRFGLPQLAAPRFRDDLPQLFQDQERTQPWWVLAPIGPFADPNPRRYCITSASTAEVRQSGMDLAGPGFHYAKLSTLWSRAADGRRNIASVILMAEDEEMETLNRASDDGLSVMWLSMLASGQEPIIEALPPATDQT
jgi:hypothetical protein